MSSSATRSRPSCNLTFGADNFTDKYANHTTCTSRYHNADRVHSVLALRYRWRNLLRAPERTNGALRPPPMPEPHPVTTAPSTPVPPAASTYLVFFDWDRADLTERARAIVATAAQASTQAQTTRIAVNGYTDLSGTKAYNQRLSIRRAQSVQDGTGARRRGENRDFDPWLRREQPAGADGGWRARAAEPQGRDRPEVSSLVSGAQGAVLRA